MTAKNEGEEAHGQVPLSQEADAPPRTGGGRFPGRTRRGQVAPRKGRDAFAATGVPLRRDPGGDMRHPRGYTTLPNLVFTDPRYKGIGTLGLAVYAAISCVAKDGRLAVASVGRLAAHAQCSSRGVFRALPILVKFGLIEIERRSGDENVYRLLDMPDQRDTGPTFSQGGPCQPVVPPRVSPARPPCQADMGPQPDGRGPPASLARANEEDEDKKHPQDGVGLRPATEELAREAKRALLGLPQDAPVPEPTKVELGHAKGLISRHGPEAVGMVLEAVRVMREGEGKQAWALGGLVDYIEQVAATRMRRQRDALAAQERAAAAAKVIAEAEARHEATRRARDAKADAYLAGIGEDERARIEEQAAAAPGPVAWRARVSLHAVRQHVLKHCIPEADGD